MAPPQPPPKGGSRPGLGGRLALLTASVLAAWLALSSRVTRDGHDSRGSVPLPAALVPLQGSPDGAPPAASSEFTTRAARELLPRLQQSAAQARLHQRWEFGGATTGARQLRIPRILHHGKQALSPQAARCRSAAQLMTCHSALVRLSPLHISCPSSAVYFPGVDAYLDRVSDISSDTRMRWGAACVHHHPGWEHVFWDLEAARQLIAEVGCSAAEGPAPLCWGGLRMP